MDITRRQFTAGVSMLTLAVGIGGLGFAGAAHAQTVGLAELMQPGPLPDMILGSADAPVTIVEYASLTCSHCAHFHETTYPELKKRYIDTGKVRFVLREFPLDITAAAGFLLARCAAPTAADKDKYFGLVDLLFQSQRTWAVQRPLEPLFNIVKQAGFTQQSFDACLANKQGLQDIDRVRMTANQKYGVSSTPTFFINGKKIAGALSITEIEKEVEPLLKS